MGSFSSLVPTAVCVRTRAHDPSRIAAAAPFLLPCALNYSTGYFSRIVGNGDIGDAHQGSVCLRNHRVPTRARTDRPCKLSMIKRRTTLTPRPRRARTPGIFAGLRNIVMSMGRIIGPLVYGMLWDDSHVAFFIVLLAIGLSPAALLVLAWRPFVKVDSEDAPLTTAERESSYVSLGGGSGEERRSGRASSLSLEGNSGVVVDGQLAHPPRK